MIRYSAERRLTYWWKRSDGKKIPPEHAEALDETAVERAMVCVDQGFVEGELSDNIRMGDKDGEDGVEYAGWWAWKAADPEPPTLKVKGTQRHNFDINYIQKLLETEQINHEDALRILGQALPVIAALRNFVQTSAYAVDDLRDITKKQAISQWMGSQKGLKLHMSRIKSSRG